MKKVTKLFVRDKHGTVAPLTDLYWFEEGMFREGMFRDLEEMAEQGYELLAVVEDDEVDK
jgi:hypothetical protein